MRRTISSVVAVIALLFFCTSSYAQDSLKTVRMYNEISLNGVSASDNGLNVSALYTAGVSVGQYFDAGLSIGYQYGLATLLKVKGNIPFGQKSMVWGYGEVSGGAGFLSSWGTVPEVSTSLGIQVRINRFRLLVGPYLLWYSRSTNVNYASLGFKFGVSF